GSRLSMSVSQATVSVFDVCARAAGPTAPDRATAPAPESFMNVRRFDATAIPKSSTSAPRSNHFPRFHYCQPMDHPVGISIALFGSRCYSAEIGSTKRESHQQNRNQRAEE